MMTRIIFFTLLSIFLFPSMTPANNIIRYAALGDSYTIGTGTTPDKSWPALLSARVKAQGMGLDLVGNLGRNGWTTEDVLRFEIAELKGLNADFATLLIGTNDWVHGEPLEVFEHHLKDVLDQMVQILGHADRIIVLTVPDYSIMPRAKEFHDGRDVAKGLAAYNTVINAECAKRGIKVIDLFALSQRLGGGVVSPDGLHPSEQGYAKWEEFIEPVVIEHLKKIGASNGSKSAER
jgi:acyl-CoA thioesterase-1